DAAHRVEHTAVILDAATRGNLLIRPTVIVNKLSAACKKRFEIGIHCVDVTALDFGYFVHVAIKVERFVIPFRIVEDHVLIHLHAVPERLRTTERTPAEFTAKFEAGEN